MRILNKLLLLAALVFPLAAQAQISTSRHNLSSGSTYTNIRAAAPGVGGGTDQICIFCHTPHNATSSKALWNHSNSALAYTWSDAATTSQGTALNSNNMTTSKRCLSCHDGSVSVGDIKNMGGAAVVLSMVGTDFTAGKLSNASYRLGGVAGTDLKNNHPVGIKYGVPVTGYRALTTACGSMVSGIACVVNGTVTLPLYNVTGTETIECGSCHEPHLTTYNTFLRVSNAASALCVTCHTK